MEVDGRLQSYRLLFTEIDIYSHAARRYLDRYHKNLALFRSFPDPDAIDTTCQVTDLTIPRKLESAHRQMTFVVADRDLTLFNLRRLETVLAHARVLLPRSLSTHLPLKAAMWAFIYTVSATIFPLIKMAGTVTIKIVASVSALGAVAAVAALATPRVWSWYRNYSFDAYQADVLQLRLTLENDLGAINDKSGDVLKESRLKFLRNFYADYLDY
ncbi:hypothetical protein QBC46DRAFT_411922 [Diplogelasinospora grovesii]|uniref:Uncharacterized protein n=1 Tax=Diplogelasinospora grovesii TaxID=303347 RepID=A0AAN6S1S3_9PEZI|nr:hypothetical protein QBC46DRAFT_411922 [Diplogelasinospora grovesii]